MPFDVKTTTRSARLKLLRRVAPTTLYMLVIATLTLTLLLYLSDFARVLPIYAGQQSSGAHRAVMSPAMLAQDPDWLMRKREHLVRRVAQPSDPNQPVACALPCAVYPGAAQLDLAFPGATLEPGTQGQDATGADYSDRNMSHLCGPGAAANALSYWNVAAGHQGAATFKDTATGATTAWDGQRNRAFILYLAWQTRVPLWPHAGLMDDHNPSSGVTLYGMREGLNWEAAGHALDWKSYFYTSVWWNQSSEPEFHADVQDDIAYARVPVIAEVNARLLPNWPSEGKAVNHYVAILGYDDAQGTYTYADTCGHSTGCGASDDALVHTISQAQLWSAITVIPVNTSTDYDAGDGGYVW